MEEDSTENVKKIIIVEPVKKTTKKINCEKERKMRVETKTWGLNEEELSHIKQLTSLQELSIVENSKYMSIVENSKYKLKIVSHIKNKLCGYKQQDILKKKLNEEEFVSFEEVITLLKESDLKCCYCSNEVYILYENVREKKQWSLDRINNDIGHNKGNLVISCLECNLKRRRTNKDAFMFTKNMVIIKEGY